MPEYKITHLDIYRCHSYVTAKNEIEAMEKFNLGQNIDGPDPFEWEDRYNDYSTTIEELT